MLKRIILWAIIIILIGVIGAYFARNILVAKAIEEGGTRALGVETDLGSAGVSISAGRLDLHDLEVRNPDGYQADNILTMEEGWLDVATGSIFSDRIEIDSLVLSGLTLDLEQIDNKGNYRTIMDNIKQLDTGSSESGDRKLVIKKLSLRNIKVDGTLVLMGKTQYQKSYVLQDFSLNNVGGDNGATIARVTATVFGALLKRAAAASGNELPGKLGEMLGSMDTRAIEKAGEEVGDKLKDLGGSLLGGDKKK